MLSNLFYTLYMYKKMVIFFVLLCFFYKISVYAKKMRKFAHFKGYIVESLWFVLR